MKFAVSIIMFLINSVSNIVGVNVNTVKKVNSFRYLGSTAPIKEFDPLNILKNKSDNRIKYTREAELQHGRLAKLATVTILGSEMLNPDNTELGINYLKNMDLSIQLPFWVLVAAYESKRMKNGWVNPFSTKTTFQLKEDYQPGNVLNVDVDGLSDRVFNSELNNGRLAMISFVGIVAQELASQKPIF